MFIFECLLTIFPGLLMFAMIICCFCKLSHFLVPRWLLKKNWTITKSLQKKLIRGTKNLSPGLSPILSWKRKGGLPRNRAWKSFPINFERNLKLLNERFNFQDKFFLVQFHDNFFLHAALQVPLKTKNGYSPPYPT